MESVAAILAQLFIFFVAAKVGGELFHRVRQPPVIGELLAGALIGPYALGWVGNAPPALLATFHDPAAAQEALDLVFHVISELGVIVLLFFVGLETRLGDILKVGGRASAVAVAGVLVPFSLGGGVGLLLGQTNATSLFLGAAMVATSVGITARVLADLGRLSSLEARIILGAAVIDDILGLMVLSVVSAMGRDGQISAAALGTITTQALLFVGLATLIGTQAVRRAGWRLDQLRIANAPFVVAIATCLGLAALAAQVGLAAIIGAFLAGMVFAEAREQFELEHRALPVYEFLVPFFFAITGSKVDWRLFLDPGLMGVALVVTALAILGKVIACGASAWGLGLRRMAIIGIGMAPRGEVGLIVASAGAAVGAIDTRIFSVIVIMSVLTTLVAPPLLTWLYRGVPAGLAAPPPAEADHVLPDL